MARMAVGDWVELTGVGDEICVEKFGDGCGQEIIGNRRLSWGCLGGFVCWGLREASDGYFWRFVFENSDGAI
jgi:hypothetical protein